MIIMYIHCSGKKKKRVACRYEKTLRVFTIKFRSLCMNTTNHEKFIIF